MEHLPTRSCIDSVFSLNDSRFGVVHFFAGMNKPTCFQIDDHSFSINDDGSVCAEVSLDYETKSVLTMSILYSEQNERLWLKALAVSLLCFFPSKSP